MTRIPLIKGDISDKDVVRSAMDGCDLVVDFAAGSYVDRSIASPEDFVRADVLDVFTLLEEGRRSAVKRYVQISTVSDSFSEDDILALRRLIRPARRVGNSLLGRT